MTRMGYVVTVGRETIGAGWTENEAMDLARAYCKQRNIVTDPWLYAWNRSPAPAVEAAIQACRLS